MLSVAAAAALLLGQATPAAFGEISITAQSVADGGKFLPLLTPPARRIGLCLVDSGVNVNPDTEGAVVERTAIDGGAPGDASASEHGTVLAMLAAAPLNGWGAVGVAPQAVQIVSVRILSPGQTTFSFNAYATGINACLQLAPTYDIRVINLSLGTSEAPSSQGYEDVANALAKATSYGVTVVAAAGNDDGGPVSYPAAYPGAVSVGATDTRDGAFCSFSNRGAGLALTAPGCALDAADPETGAGDYNYRQGTSEASVIASAGLAALEAYEPGLSPEAAKEDLTAAQGGTLDIASAFRRAGLAQLVAEGEAREPAATVPSPSGAPVQRAFAGPNLPTSHPVSKPSPLPTPLTRLKQLAHRRLLLLIAGRPVEARTEARFLGRREGSRRLRILRTLRGSFDRLLLPSGVRTIEVRFIDYYDLARASAWRTLAVPPMGSVVRGRPRP